MNKCIRIIASPPRTIRCTMSDGRVLEFIVTDIDKFDTPLLHPLKDKRYFRKVFLEAGAPTWPNGYDICPDYVAKHGKVIGRVKKTA